MRPEAGFPAGGGWTATKWFPEHDGRSAEVYLNYHLGERRGEFSEKDSDYGDDPLAIFASAFRDGPRPERTPENDPNVTRTAPTLGRPRRLLPRAAAYHSFSPKNHFAVYQDGPTIFALPIGKPDSNPYEVARFDHPPWEVHVLDEDSRMLVQEGVPEKPSVSSSGDPMRIWWVDPKSKEKKLLLGPEKALSLAEAPVSPGHRYVAFHEWRDNAEGKGRTELLSILDREGGKRTTFTLAGKDLSVVGWKKNPAGLRAVAMTDRWQFDKKGASESYLGDPATGKLERQENVDARLEIGTTLSPDGNRRVRVGKDDLTVTETDGGEQRRFVFHEDDRRFVGEECVEWAGPCYLKFNGQRLALIDVATMKMCFPASADGTKVRPHSCKFSTDFRWAFYDGEGIEGEGSFLAPVEAPKGR